MSFPGTFAPTLFAAAGYTNELSTTFDGVDEYIDCGTDASLQFERTDPFSISAWVKHDSLTDYQAYFCTIDGTNNFRGIQFNKHNNHKLAATLIANVSGGGILTVHGDTTLIVDTWHHVVFTWDGSRVIAGIKLYVDGVLQVNTPVSNTTLNATIINPVPMALGRRPQGIYYMNGHIDESAFWDKELSGTEVSEIYNSGVPSNLVIQSHAANIVAYWRMGDGDTNTTIVDQVGPNNGTLTNMDATNYIEDTPP